MIIKLNFKYIGIFLIILSSCKSDDDNLENSLFSPPEFVKGTFVLADDSTVISTITFTDRNIIMDFQCCDWDFNFNEDFNSPDIAIIEKTEENDSSSYSFNISGPSSEFPTSNNLCLDPNGDCEFRLGFTLGFLVNTSESVLFLDGNGFLGSYVIKQ